MSEAEKRIERELLKASSRCAAEKLSHPPDIALTAFRVGFLAGARWAWANPQWRRVEEELPSQGEQVLCVCELGSVRWHDVYSFLHGKFVNCNYNWRQQQGSILAWVPLPELPKEEGE